MIEKYKIAFVTGNPSWHQPELYEKISSNSRIDLMVYFCSEETIHGKLLSSVFDVKNQHWGQDLLKGYNYKFLRNISFIKPEFNKTKLFGYINPEIWNEIRKGGYHAVIVTMWNEFTCWITVFACKIFNTPVLFLGDSTHLTEESRPGWLRKVKRLILGKCLFRFASGFLYLNEPNRQFYHHYRVSDERLFFYPYSVDFSRYDRLRPGLVELKKQMRLENGISEDAYVISFMGRLSVEKCPLDLLAAFKKAKANNKVLIFVGDGTLRTAIEEFVQRENLLNVRILGFKPRMDVLKFYVMADVLVLPSGFEPHGLVINEAMCFGLPVIVSDKVGAGFDLVKHNENGYIYSCGDTDKLAYYIDELSDEAKRKRFGQKSLEIVKNWDHEKAIDGLLSALKQIVKND